MIMRGDLLRHLTQAPAPQRCWVMHNETNHEKGLRQSRPGTIGASLLPLSQTKTQDRGANPHPKSSNTKNTPHLHKLIRKVRVNFCPLPCDVSQEPSRDHSEKKTC